MVGRGKGTCIRRVAGCAFARSGRLRLPNGCEKTAGSSNCAMKAKKMNTGRLLTVIVGSALLVGCTVGPKYHRPAVQTPNSLRGLADNPQLQAQVASYADLPWWQVFQDPKLQELIRAALRQNYDLQLATERIN